MKRIMGFICLLFSANAFAGSIGSFNMESAVVTLYDEPCRLTKVIDFRYRATWAEPPKIYEGCYAVHPVGLVVFYFEDRTMALYPAQAIKPASGI